ncbi:MAG TPA: cytochrome c [Flavisolibacter sp.]|nr:cytochrome c [Flavisolibacter sp.]
MLRTCFPVLACLILAACQGNKASLAFLSTDSLPLQTVLVRNDRDTSWTTANGAIIRIEKESFSAKEVRLNIREAFTMEQMILAGLTTESDGKTLSSGGMFYLAPEDEKVRLNKTIRISIPTPFVDEGMQLYKGEEKADGINWTAPEPLSPDSQPSYLDRGKLSFLSNCASCHALDKVLTGPALLGVEQRGPWRDRKELLAFTRDPAGYIKRSTYACQLQKQYGSIMPGSLLSDEEIFSIYDYIRNEDGKRGILPEGSQGELDACLDSCAIFDSIRNEVSRLADERNGLIEGNRARVDYQRLANSQATGGAAGSATAPVAGNNAGPVVEGQRGIYYEIDIKSFGWANIDRLIVEGAGGSVRLSVTIDESLATDFNVFIAVPQYRVFDQGSRLNDGKSYGFFNEDGTLPLPVGTKVFVFALSEAQDKLVLGYQEFIAGKEQTITLRPSLVTKNEFNDIVSSFSLDAISIEAKDSKNAAAIRETANKIAEKEAKMETYRPKNCDCQCGYSADTSYYEAPAVYQ